MAAVPDVTPRLSVVLATRHGHPFTGRALASVLAIRDPGFDIWVADATPTGGAAVPFLPAGGDPRVHVLRVATRGSTRIHNQAIARSGGELLAITDDDCEVAPDWVAETIRAFDRDPRIGIVFGNVHAAPAGDGAVPAYVRSEEFVARDLGDKPRVEGVWACMGVRRETWRSLGGFDERFGHDGRFPGCADGDLAIRALAAGWRVLETPRLSVTLHRSLPPDRRRAAALAYTYASGALIGTHLRRRTPGIPRLVAGFARRWVRGGAHPAIGLGSRPRRVRRALAFAHGVVRGLASPAGSRP